MKFEPTTKVVSCLSKGDTSFPDCDLTILKSRLPSYTMSTNGEAPPDLASILKTLADLTPQNNQHQTPAQIQPPSQPAVHTQAEPNREFQQVWQQQLEKASQPRSTTPVDAPPKIVDPASIIEWSAGLRCVTKTVAKHDNIINEIRKVCVPTALCLSSIADRPPSDDQSSTRA